MVKSREKKISRTSSTLLTVTYFSSATFFYYSNFLVKGFDAKHDASWQRNYINEYVFCISVTNNHRILNTVYFSSIQVHPNITIET